MGAVDDDAGGEVLRRKGKCTYESKTHILEQNSVVNRKCIHHVPRRVMIRVGVIAAR